MKFLVCAAILLLAYSAVILRAESDTNAADVKALVQRGALVIDVRSAEEFASGHVEGAVNIPHTQIVEEIKKIPGADKKEIVLYCRSGRRSGLAKSALSSAGYQHLHNAGGYDDIVSALR